MIANITANIGYALDRILAEKLPVLRQLRMYDRRILLIWAEHLFAEPDIVREILQGKGITSDDVDTILLVHDGRVYWVADPSHVFL